LPRGRTKKNEPTPPRPALGQAEKDMREQRKALRDREWQFNPPIVNVNIQTGKVTWYRSLFGEPRRGPGDQKGGTINGN